MQQSLTKKQSTKLIFPGEFLVVNSSDDILIAKVERPDDLAISIRDKQNRNIRGAAVFSNAYHLIRWEGSGSDV